MSLPIPSMRVLACASVLMVFGAARGAEVLTLESVQTAALESQPLLDSQEANVSAMRDRAIVAGQLPDPELGVGVNELPINTADAWSLRRDTDTDVMIGITQSFPRAAKRRLRQLQQEHATQAAEEQLHDMERQIRRDAGLAFAEVVLREREYALVEEQLKQAGLQREAAEIRVRSSTGLQSELLAATVEQAMLRDQLAEARQMLTHARIELERWIGPEAQRPVDATAMVIAPPPDLVTIVADLANHPALRASERSREAAEAGIDLAREGYKPDWRLELAYGYRPEFSEMMTLRASVGLPVFRHNRQDREAAAARSDLSQASANRANLLREFQAHAALAHHDSTQFALRAQALEADALPVARSRETSAEASYRSGRGPLSDVLTARQALLEAEMRALELRATAFKRAIELQYFVNEGAQP